MSLFSLLDDYSPTLQKRKLRPTEIIWPPSGRRTAGAEPGCKLRQVGSGALALNSYPALSLLGSQLPAESLQAGGGLSVLPASRTWSPFLRTPEVL